MYKGDTHNGATYIYGDCMAGIKITSKPKLVLQKKKNTVCYNFVEKSVAMEELLSTLLTCWQNSYAVVKEDM